MRPTGREGVTHMRSILVAVDGSEGSKRALRFATDLAKETQATLYTLTVIEPPTALPFGFLDSTVTLPSVTGAHTEEVTQMVRALHHDFPNDLLQVLVKVGRASETVVSQSEILDVDLVVMGARGLANPAVRLLVGSVTDKVLRQSQRPVTVVP